MYGQAASAYTLSASSVTYAALTGTTNVSVHTATVDEAISNAIALPFTFTFAGTAYPNIKVSSNGWLTFGTTTAATASNTSANAASIKPVLFSLWDDLQNTVIPRYVTSGSTPNRIFKLEWYAQEWNWNATGDVISFQIWLYETSNIIEYIYNQGAVAVTNGSASIGIYDAAGTYITLDGSSATPTKQTGTFTTTISAKPASGQKYTFTPPVPPANDNCAGAIPITLDAAAITGDVTNATQTLAAAPCAGNADDDIWYSFTTVAAGNYTITVDGAASFDAVLDLRSGACNGANVACADVTGSGGIEAITSSLSAATTYLVRCYHFQGTVSATPTFTIQVASPATPPTNDDCAGAIALTLDAIPISGTVTGATQTLAATCVGTADDDVWYSFTTTAAGNYTITVDGSSNFNSVMDLSSGACNGSNISCTNVTGNDGIETITYSCAASTTYYIRIYDFASGVPVTKTFTIRVTAPQCGTYHAGTGKQFVKISDIASVLNTNGVSCACTYYLDDATYSETPITINSISGTSNTNTVTIKPNSAVSPVITITATASPNDFGFKLNGTSYLTFDGSNVVAGTTRDLSVIMAGVNSSNCLITGGANNITIKNTKIQGYSNTSGNSGISINFGGATTSDDNLFRNNEIYKVYSGIYYNNFFSGTYSNNKIQNNLIGSTDPTKYIGYAGIRSDAPNITNLEISKNEIFNIITSAALIPTGIFIYTSASSSINGLAIFKNKIHDIIYTGTANWGAKGIFMQEANADPQVTIYNNFIWSLAADGDGVQESIQIMGIDIAGGGTTGMAINHNSIYLNPNTSYGLDIDLAFAAGLSIRGNTGLTVKNNIFSCNVGKKAATTATNTKGCGIYTNTANPFTVISNNIYYITNQDVNYVGMAGTFGSSTYADLTTWGTFSGETGSYIQDPNYTSVSNLHITISNDGGTPIAEISDDIDEEVRSLTTPDIGADELNVSLPIGLLFFEVECEDNNLVLNWATADETNNDYFTIERSTNAQNFEELATINGAGNSYTTILYKYIDKNPAAELPYYRLKQTDYDGKYKYSTILSGVNCRETMMNPSVYPNPSNGNYSISSNTNISNIHIFNLPGGLIYQKENVNASTINVDISEFPKGIYLLKITFQNQTTFHKIINQ